jgi:hypothetical protein
MVYIKLCQRNSFFLFRGKNLVTRPNSIFVIHFRKILRLLVVVHSFLVRVLSIGDGAALEKLLLTESSFLVLLAEGAETAAAGDGEIRQAGALEVVLLADFGALHPEGDDAAAEATGGGNEEALNRSLVSWVLRG